MGKVLDGVAEAIEGNGFSKGKSRAYIGLFFAAIAGNFIHPIMAISSRPHSDDPLRDFDVFHLAGRMVRDGQTAEVYRWLTFWPRQKELSATDTFMPWTYPPQFNLIVEALAGLPAWNAYLLFTATTLIAYLLVLSRIAKDNFRPTLLICLPAVLACVACGQNGLLTGALIGLTGLLLLGKRALAGAPLGLMAIKPHLAIAYACYVLVTRRIAVAAVAGCVLGLTCVAATLRYGPEIWSAFLVGVSEAKLFLVAGAYPLFRMISVYATLRSLEAPAAVALAAQALTAIAALALCCLPAKHRSTTQSLGLVCLASVLLSPYAYDYDLPVAGVGLALLMPDLIRLGRPAERLALYAATWVAGGWGIVATRLEKYWEAHAGLPLDRPPALGGVAALAMFLIAWNIVRRDAAESARPALADTPALTTAA